MHLDAKTTLKNHINAGSVTLAELVMLNDYYPINLNAVMKAMRDPRVPFASGGDEQGHTVNTSEPVITDSEFTDDERAFAAALGIDVD